MSDWVLRYEAKSLSDILSMVSVDIAHTLGLKSSYAMNVMSSIHSLESMVDTSYISVHDEDFQTHLPYLRGLRERGI